MFPETRSFDIVILGGGPAGIAGGAAAAGFGDESALVDSFAEPAGAGVNGAAGGNQAFGPHHMMTMPAGRMPASGEGRESMTLESLIQIAQLGTIVVGFLGVAVTLRSHRRQMHAQMFIEFSSRLHDILGSMPVEVWFSSDGEETEVRSADLTRACLQCFHVVANLFQLHQAGYISQDLWTPWQHGIRRTMQRAALQQQWLALEPVFSHQREFCRYMRFLMGDKQRCAPSRRCGPHCRQVLANPGEE